ncbi:MAG: multicopper oxidase domain-containing protein [Chitinophagales bacterium]
MRLFLLYLQFFGFLNLLLAQSFDRPFYVPDTIKGASIQLEIKDTVHSFFPGLNSPSFSYNGSYLGPTIILEKNQEQNFEVRNELMMPTTVHWHGMHVPAEMDGGPHTVINPGATWQAHFTIKDDASTMWYHSHLHHHTMKQVTKGLAGMIIIRDEEEAQLNLPRTYGVDDIPLIIQDRQFLNGALIDSAIMGDSILINGVISPFIDLSANVVRFRILNGSNHRVYMLGFSNDMSFELIASDGGLYQNAINANRILVAPGERYELLIDLQNLEDSSIYMYTYASEMPLGYPGGSFVIPDDDVPSLINGLDLAILKINVQSSNPSGVLNPDLVGLNSFSIWDTSTVDVKRSKEMNAEIIKGELVWTINSKVFDLEVMNDTIVLDSKELWTLTNSSGIIHPFHIHMGHFYIVSRAGQAAPLYEQGKKDVAIVKPGETLKFVMHFEDFVNEEVPYMYHCHILNHEDNAMMAQFIVVDSSFFNSIKLVEDNRLSLYPNPSQAYVNLSVEDGLSIESISVLNLLGEIVLELNLEAKQLHDYKLNLSELARNTYLIAVKSKDGTRIKKVILD